MDSDQCPWVQGRPRIRCYASGNILTGKLFGAKNYYLLFQLSNRLIKYALVVGVVMGCIGALLYKPIGAIFTNDPMVLETFYEVFWIVLLMQPFCALAFVCLLYTSDAADE